LSQSKKSKPNQARTENLRTVAIWTQFDGLGDVGEGKI